MSKRPKPKRKGAKRGPKEERLIIPDVQAALDRILKAKPTKLS
jgi:hypothetical protein